MLKYKIPQIVTLTLNQNIVTRISLFPVYYSVFHCLVQLVLYGGIFSFTLMK